MSSPPVPWRHVRTVTFLFAPLWAGSGLLFGVAGLGYAWVRSERWEARQPLLISGHELLSSQPSLERLKTGLLEATLRTSQLAGTLTENNPKLRAAISQLGGRRDEPAARARTAASCRPSGRGPGGGVDVGRDRRGVDLRVRRRLPGRPGAGGTATRASLE